MNKIKGFFAGFRGLLVGIMLVLGAGVTLGAVDSWSHFAEVQVPFSQSVTLAATPSVVCTATAGFAHNVRSLTITDTASGVVTLYNGPGGAGTTIIGTWGVIANTPFPLSEEQLGQGITTSVGSGLYVCGATGTITLQVRDRLSSTSPR